MTKTGITEEGLWSGKRGIRAIIMQSDKSNNRSLNKIFTLRRIGGDIWAALGGWVDISECQACQT